VTILANVADGTAARAARQAPVEGVGLFRTELCFLERDSEPSVDEQAAIYAEVLEAFAGHKVVIRTLDAGSDKPLKFVTTPQEENPALGVRGFRIVRGNADLVARQLDAIAAVVIGGTSLSGGRGTVLGTIIGAFIMSVLNNGLRIMSVEEQWQVVITGIIIIVAVYVDNMLRKKS
jgi:phosphoenolpyruvate synthase/pyruvate phosphate dikinase